MSEPASQTAQPPSETPAEAASEKTEKTEKPVSTILERALLVSLADGLEQVAEPFDKMGAVKQAEALRRGAMHARSIEKGLTEVKQASSNFFEALSKVIPPSTGKPIRRSTIRKPPHVRIVK